MRIVDTCEWQYEYIAKDGSVIWIPEDDQLSASYKALKNTGRIRSRVVRVVEHEWRVKQQTMVERVEP